MKIRRMEQGDVAGASIVHKESFSRQKMSSEWIKCVYSAFPRSMCFVVESEGEIIGYIIWTQKSGFRTEVVLELEQIAVLPSCRNRGVARNLIETSLVFVKEQLSEQESVLKYVVVTTRTDNYAQEIYKQVLGAKVEAVIANLYSADEVFMVARQV